MKHIIETPFKVVDDQVTEELNRDGNGDVVYTEHLLDTEHCSYVGTNENTAFAIPLTEKNDPRVEGYEVNSDHPEVKLEQQLPFPADDQELRVYYKQKMVTASYQAKDPKLGTVSAPDLNQPEIKKESRLYFTGDSFKGSTATANWNAEFIGWTKADKDPNVKANIIEGGGADNPFRDRKCRICGPL